MASRDSDKVIQRVATREEVEGHEYPGQVATLHWEAPDRDLNVRHELGPDVNDAKEVRTLHQQVVVGDVRVQEGHEGIEEQHRSEIRLLLLPKVLLNRAHRVIDHHHTEQERHAEWADEEESRQDSPDLALEDRVPVEDEFVGRYDAVRHAEGEEKGDTQIPASNWLYFHDGFANSVHLSLRVTCLLLVILFMKLII